MREKTKLCLTDFLLNLSFLFVFLIIIALHINFKIIQSTKILLVHSKYKIFNISNKIISMDTYKTCHYNIKFGILSLILIYLHLPFSPNLYFIRYDTTYNIYFLGFNEEVQTPMPVTMSGSSMQRDISQILIVTFVCNLAFKIIG